MRFKTQFLRNADISKRMTKFSGLFVLFTSLAVFANDPASDVSVASPLAEMAPFFKIGASQPIWDGSANEKLRPIKKLVESRTEIDSLETFIESYRSKGLLKKAALAQNQMGMRYLTLAQNGNVENKAAHLQSAEKAFSKASEFFNPTSMPIDWARVQKNLAITLQDQAQTLDQNDKRNVELLTKSIAIYHSVIDVYKANGDMRNTAMAQMYLATALQDRARIADDKASMAAADKALVIYQQVISALTKYGCPQDRDVAMENYANMLVYRAKKEGDPTEMLQLAVDTYRLLLKNRKRGQDPQAWAHIQANLGRALYELANSGNNPAKNERLAESMAAFYESLKIYTQVLPQQHARSQVGLGFTLFEISQTLPKDKKDWFFIEALVNIVEGSTALTGNPKLITDGENIIKQLQKTREPQQGDSKSLL